MSCSTCGKTVYGKSKVQELFEQQKKEFEERLMQPEVREELARRAAEKARKEQEEQAFLQKKREAQLAAEALEAAQAQKEKERREELARKEEEVRISAQLLALKCAWKDCTNPHTDRSMYCSDACCHKNARWKYEQRRKAKRKMLKEGGGG